MFKSSELHTFERLLYEYVEDTYNYFLSFTLEDSVSLRVVVYQDWISKYEKRNDGIIGQYVLNLDTIIITNLDKKYIKSLGNLIVKSTLSNVSP